MCIAIRDRARRLAYWKFIGRKNAEWDAEDAAQEVVLKVLSGKFKERHKERALVAPAFFRWVQTITNNVIFDYFRDTTQEDKTFVRECDADEMRTEGGEGTILDGLEATAGGQWYDEWTRERYQKVELDRGEEVRSSWRNPNQDADAKRWNMDDLGNSIRLTFISEYMMETTGSIHNSRAYLHWLAKENGNGKMTDQAIAKAMGIEYDTLRQSLCLWKKEVREEYRKFLREEVAPNVGATKRINALHSNTIYREGTPMDPEAAAIDAYLQAKAEAWFGLCESQFQSSPFM
jgi:DNA-directed RNA polymerase specialized sigma24 family protein